VFVNNVLGKTKKNDKNSKYPPCHPERSEARLPFLRQVNPPAAGKPERAGISRENGWCIWGSLVASCLSGQAGAFLGMTSVFWGLKSYVLTLLSP